MMNLNVTLFGQMITFAFFVWFTMKYIWPPMLKALEDRKQKIADGLAAAERGKHELELAKQKSIELLHEAKIQAAHIIEETHKRAAQLLEEAKDSAQNESKRLLAAGSAEIEREKNKARQELKGQIAKLAMTGAEKILAHNIDAAANSALLDKLITEL